MIREYWDEFHSRNVTEDIAVNKGGFYQNLVLSNQVETGKQKISLRKITSFCILELENGKYLLLAEDEKTIRLHTINPESLAENAYIKPENSIDYLPLNDSWHGEVLFLTPGQPGQLYLYKQFSDPICIKLKYDICEDFRFVFRGDDLYLFNMNSPEHNYYISEIIKKLGFKVESYFYTNIRYVYPNFIF